MAAVNQDFVTYAGNDVSPIFTVKNSAGATVDISSVIEITWAAKGQSTDTVPVISKTKTGGQITFVTNGQDGQFQVAIAAADTAPLTGYFIHEASITDSSNHITTVAIGRMQIGVPPTWTYDPTKVLTVPLYQVRQMIGDTLPGRQLLTDPEILANIANNANAFLAASQCCRDIAARKATEVDIVNGTLKTNYSNITKAFMLLALDFQQRGLISSVPYAGGISVDDKQAQVDDTDRVSPQFLLMMFDDLLPESPVGQQVPGARQPLQGAG